MNPGAYPDARLARGRPKLPAELRRDCPIMVRFREREARDLRTIADEWGVYPAEAAWGLLADCLARLRRRSAELGPSGLALAASRAIARLEPLALEHVHNGRGGGEAALARGAELLEAEAESSGAEAESSPE